MWPFSHQVGHRSTYHVLDPGCLTSSWLLMAKYVTLLERSAVYIWCRGTSCLQGSRDDTWAVLLGCGDGSAAQAKQPREKMLPTPLHWAWRIDLWAPGIEILKGWSWAWQGWWPGIIQSMCPHSWEKLKTSRAQSAAYTLSTLPLKHRGAPWFQVRWAELTSGFLQFPKVGAGVWWTSAPLWNTLLLGGKCPFCLPMTDWSFWSVIPCSTLSDLWPVAFVIGSSISSLVVFV